MALPLIHRILDGLERSEIRGDDRAMYLEQVRSMREVIPNPNLPASRAPIAALQRHLDKL
ncbi:hypothetical protein [Phytomonospora endophytica]|uniref:Uncharacterized protein n=1 Tax=Phytomonospora endophytica TaxID=714109 RepID=A0A841FSB3_9ACTN|nr:hypothetical protein [Phytomonospora endophytica]MBB6038936.1 hypothetical protein [Phytomonospora endophytica]GIG67962.1 hypothetical protein Pen01_42570 [Phytomonospora endophytica]